MLGEIENMGRTFAITQEIFSDCKSQKGGIFEVSYVAEINRSQGRRRGDKERGRGARRSMTMVMRVRSVGRYYPVRRRRTASIMLA